jgi:hypothetical protein
MFQLMIPEDDIPSNQTRLMYRTNFKLNHCTRAYEEKAIAFRTSSTRRSAPCPSRQTSRQYRDF